MSKSILDELKEGVYYNTDSLKYNSKTGKYTGDYTKIPFVFFESTEEFGRRKVIQEFINSENIQVQDLGASENKYTLRIVFSVDSFDKTKDFILTGNLQYLVSDNFSYLEKRQKLIQELMKKGNGILCHPIQGNIKVSFLSGRIVESITSLGFPDLEVTFVRVGKIPVKKFDTSIIYDKYFACARALYPLANEVLELSSSGNLVPKNEENFDFKKASDNLFETTGQVKPPTLLDKFREKCSNLRNSKFINNIKSFGKSVNNIVSNIKSAVREIQKFSDMASDFNNYILNLREDLNNLIISPFAIGQSLINVLNSLDSVIDNPLAQFNMYMGLAEDIDSNSNYMTKQTTNGDSSKKSSQEINTQELLEMKNNEIALNNLVKSYCIMAACNSILSYNFNDVDEAEKIRLKLNTIFNNLISTQSNNQVQGYEYDTNIDVDIIDILKQINQAINDYFDNLIITLPNIGIINIRENDIFNIMNNYYNNLDYIDNILNLNKDLYDNPRFISGDIKVIEV